MFVLFTKTKTILSFTMLGVLLCQIIIRNKFKVTVCEADSTTSMESDSTLCYDNSDSDNDSVSSGPMFVEDKDKTDDELPDIELPDIENPCNDVREGAATYPDAHAVFSCPDKCECEGDNSAKENEVFPFLSFLVIQVFFCFLLFFGFFAQKFNVIAFPSLFIFVSYSV